MLIHKGYLMRILWQAGVGKAIILWKAYIGMKWKLTRNKKGYLIASYQIPLNRKCESVKANKSCHEIVTSLRKCPIYQYFTSTATGSIPVPCFNRLRYVGCGNGKNGSSCLHEWSVLFIDVIPAKQEPHMHEQSLIANAWASPTYRTQVLHWRINYNTAR